MKFMTLYQDTSKNEEMLVSVIGKNFLGARIEHVCRLDVLNDEDDSLAYHVLALCQEGSLLSYLRVKLFAKKNNIDVLKLKCWPVLN